MDQHQRIRCMDELRAHQEQANALSVALARLRAGNADSGAPRPDVVLFTAQLMRHRISAALLTAELTAA